jgi:hypothetical protein
MDSMRRKPDSDDYLAIFGRYKEDFGDVYMEPEDDWHHRNPASGRSLTTRPSRRKRKYVT